MTNPVSSGVREIYYQFDADGAGRCEAAPYGDELATDLGEPPADAVDEGAGCGRKAVMAGAVCLGGAAGTLAVSSVGGPAGGLVAALAAGVECGLLVDDALTCYERK